MKIFIGRKSIRVIPTPTENMIKPQTFFIRGHICTLVYLLYAIEGLLILVSLFLHLLDSFLYFRAILLGEPVYDIRSHVDNLVEGI